MIWTFSHEDLAAYDRLNPPTNYSGTNLFRKPTSELWKQINWRRNHAGLSQASQSIRAYRAQESPQEAQERIRLLG